MVTAPGSTRSRLAVYTVVYPAVRPFLAAWYRSVVEQTDGAFDLWISLDGLDRSDVTRASGGEPKAQWLVAPAGATVA